MIGQREYRPCAIEHSHFVLPSLTALLRVLLIVIWLSSYCNGDSALSSDVCQDISEIEVRFRDYFSEYLGFHTELVQGEEFKYVEHGQVVGMLTESARMCCEKMNVSFVWLGNKKDKSPIQHLVKESVFTDTDSKKFIFYFPEFSDKGMTQVYRDAFPRPFLPVVKSPGHAIIMRAADAKKGLSAFEILKPSAPLITLLVTLAVVFGIAVWFLVSLQCSEKNIEVEVHFKGYMK